MCHTAPVVFPVDFDGSDNVYTVHYINVQLVTGPVIMPTKEEHGSDSGSESLDKPEPRDILHYHVERRDQSRCSRKGKTIGSRVLYLHFTAFNVP
jgi:hypothetical protein